MKSLSRSFALATTIVVTCPPSLGASALTPAPSGSLYARASLNATHGQFLPATITAQDVSRGNRFATLDPRELSCAVTAFHLSDTRS